MLKPAWALDVSHCIGVRSPSRPFSFGQPLMPIGSRTSSTRVGVAVRCPISSPWYSNAVAREVNSNAATMRAISSL